MGDGLSSGDPNSYSNPDEIAVSHINLLWKIDFQKKNITGKVSLNANRKKGGVKNLILDSSNLNILEVKDDVSGNNLDFKVFAPDPKFGSKMEIMLPNLDSERYNITITYETSPKASALLWLDPEQTAGKKHPYLFSQCQITAPRDLVVLMSAIRQGDPVDVTEECKVHRFQQKVPIPICLIAIAVGNLESRKIGPRSHLWSEREFVDAIAQEFSETELMLSTAESICGPYVWGIYDLLVLPPSFPLGGMENPCLTFVTPTVLADDGSVAEVIAHEIAHSWTGNLITNKNFEHYWLNEGFTMFVERKILGKVRGHEARLFSAYRGFKDLIDEIKTQGEDNPLTQLVVDLKNVSPNDSYSVVPYEKGHTFLFYLEEILGGPEIFDPFLRNYLDAYKYQSIDTDDFKKYLYEYFPKNKALKKVDWEKWVRSPGMPPVLPDYSTHLDKACDSLKSRWIEWSGDETVNFSINDLSSFSASQIQEFLMQLFLENPLSISKLSAMQKAYDLDNIKNWETHYRWLRLCIKGQWTEKIPLALKFVTKQGRMKYVRSIYRELYEWKEARPEAIRHFKTHRKAMMFLTAYKVAKDMHLEEE
ncbi:hypothetical protein R5R35_010123 [Gryllus longicercus]|uniref:Peptidase M1 leukotriene A4 hydrolase/aminopeptidase C-terminal domain-containing protein n=1 Tax=Gryllus longicercus TaxID=2509291 RepID=A0AAN9VQY7_9ORTH